MDLKIKDKIIVVSGGARGIGAGITKILAQEGALPVIIGKDEVDNKAFVDKMASLGLKVDSFTADLSHPAPCKQVIEAIVEKYGTLHGIVNNAGVNDNIGLQYGNYGGFVASYHKNVVHYYLLVQNALPELIKNEGVILNISSKVAETGQGDTSGYAAANGARNALTREWAVELLKYNIRVNALIISECLTPLYESWIDTFEKPEEKLKTITDRIPLGKRMTTVDEIGNSAAFLLSPLSSHTTGQLIHVDGGYVHLDRAIK